MSKFIARKVVMESIEDVFRAFMVVNKREFPKFSEKNPLGSKCSKVIKSSGKQSIKMIMEVTEYEFESVYQVTGKLGEDRYISTYKFIAEELDKTRIELIEEQHVTSFGSKIGLLIGGLSGNKKANAKLSRVVEGVEEEIASYKRKMERNKKKSK